MTTLRQVRTKATLQAGFAERRLKKTLSEIGCILISTSLGDEHGETMKDYYRMMTAKVQMPYTATVVTIRLWIYPSKYELYGHDDVEYPFGHDQLWACIGMALGA